MIQKSSFEEQDWLRPLLRFLQHFIGDSFFLFLIWTRKVYNLPQNLWNKFLGFFRKVFILLIQSMISRALDEGEFVAMASLDMSSAFDVVDVPLLIKRLQIIGLPNDI